MAQKNAAAKVGVNVKESVLEWTGKKLGGEHYGELKISDGYLLFTKERLTGGFFEIDMNSIVCTDITDEKSNKRLVDHLKSEDFFSVIKFPTARFEITKVEYKSNTNYIITGNLTIKDKTNPLTFPVTFNTGNGAMTASPSMVFDRSKYDVKFGSQSFFANLGDKLVYDDIEMNVKLILQ
ncbi:MAG TPA: YceI family protein [Cyclobacteriaceae bacterium]|nr:YceI family protein [Cyclobacteriaceae bacterium]HRJ80923.1 YceI family protein [Cyclobacteriaceae bacterium]